MPEAPVFSRLLTIPKVTAEQLEETVHWELKPLIPVPLTDVDIAFLEIGEKVVNGQAMLDIYAVAAPKTLTDRYQKMANMAGINLLAIETESLANTRTVAFNIPASGDMMVADFGANGTDLVVARNGVPVFAQSISTGSDAFTKAIAADYGIDLATAEKYKRAYGVDYSKGEGKIARTIEPLMQILVNEMSRTLTYFKQRVGDTGATKLFMCGEAANMPGLADYLTKNLNLQAELIDPLTKIKVSPTAQKALQQLSPVGFTVAIGLGLKVN
jgi:type IV pilus assembly protein PilM